MKWSIPQYKKGRPGRFFAQGLNKRGIPFSTLEMFIDRYACSELKRFASTDGKGTFPVLRSYLELSDKDIRKRISVDKKNND